MGINRKAFLACTPLLVACLMLAGSAPHTRVAGNARADVPYVRAALAVHTQQQTPAVTSVATSVASTLRFPAGGGKIVYGEAAAQLSAAQEKLLIGYMDHYYGSLADLEPGDPSALFAGDAAQQVESDIQMLEALCGVRAMQRTDLSLTGYSFTLTVQTVEEDEEKPGDIRVRASEDSTQKFAAYPGVDSKSFGVSHTFVLTQTGDGWRIREHRQAGSQGRVARGLGRWRPGEGGSAQAGAGATSDSVRLMLQNARRDVAARTAQGTAAAPSFAHTYNRDAAVTYARRWAGERNSEHWPSYDRYGGNCQNFTSQAMLAGGIPMDVAAPGQWKWYSDIPNSSFAAAGRSPAWSGVEEFLAYVQTNSGPGMVAQADAPYYSGQPGDILHLGVDGQWRHTVMITRVMKDAAGNTVDYLVASNTANLLDFPAGAYYYTQQMLIRIYGWN